MKTLHEVTQIVGMTRRVIQEYEKAGLATAPTATNKYGHLLYEHLIRNQAQAHGSDA